MSEMKIYRALQTHAANINRLVSGLYNANIDANQALADAQKEIQIVKDKLDETKLDETKAESA